MKYALVSAATSSIGRSIAETLSKAGYALILHYFTNQSLAEELGKDLKARPIRANLLDRNEIKSFLEELHQGPKLDLIVNNAALVMNEEDKDFEMWEQVFRMNAIVPALVMAHAKELMNETGAIINISSVYGQERFGSQQLPAYSASKSALDNLTRTFAKKLAPNIRVNAIAPGYVNSKWNEDLSESEREKLSHHQLTGKFVEPYQVAELVVTMALNTAFNGEIVYLDGGYTLRSLGWER